MAGGSLSDWKTLPCLIGILVARAVTYAAIDLAVGNGVAMSVLMLVWGAVGFGPKQLLRGARTDRNTMILQGLRGQR